MANIWWDWLDHKSNDKKAKQEDSPKLLMLWLPWGI